VSLLEALDCGVIIADQVGLVLAANVRAHTQLGVTNGLAGRSVREPGWPWAALVDERGGALSSSSFPLVEVVNGVQSAVALVGAVLQPGAPPDWLEVSAQTLPHEGQRLAVCTVREASRNGTHRSLWAYASRLRALLDSLSDTYFALDENDRVVDCSREAIMRSFSEGRTSPLGRPFEDLLSGRARDEAREALAEARTLGGSAFELEWQEPDGRRFCEAVCRPLAGGHVAVLLRDVTDRWRAEEELVALSELHRLVADNAHDVIYRLVLSPTPRLEYISPSVERLVGYSPQAFYADPGLIGRLPRADFSSTFHEQTTGASDFSQPVEMCLVRADGGECWVEQTATPTWTTDGGVAALDVVMRDVTDRHEQVERLRRREALFRLLADNCRDVVWSTRLVPMPATEYVSPSVQGLLGYSPEEFLADPQLFLRIARESSRPFVEQVRAGLEPRVQPVLLTLTHKDGHAVWAEGSVALVRDETGTPVAATGVLRDVTGRVLAGEFGVPGKGDDASG
jgi:PAS domain S-box-containing protein